MVPPMFEMLFCSSIMSTTLCGVSGSISVLLAFLKPNTFRANSMDMVCIPMQMPRQGTLFSRANFSAANLPSIPRVPNPGATTIPFKFFSFSVAFSSEILSDKISFRLSFLLWKALACFNASIMDIYASGSCTYFPTSPIRTSSVAFSNFSTKPTHSVISAGGVWDKSKSIFVSTTSSNFSCCIFSGTR